MQFHRICWFNFVVLSLLVGGSHVRVHADDALDLRRVRETITKSLSLVQSSSAVYVKERQCFSCHHQALPAMMLSLAREHGFTIDGDAAHEQSEFTREYFFKRRERVAEGKDVPGSSYSAGYALVGLGADRWPADETTTALVDYLFAQQQPDGHWAIKTHRPPLEDSDFTATALAVRGLRLFALEERAAKALERIAKARDWLLNADARTQEDKVFRLFGLHWSGAPQESIQTARESLLADQRDDGGWAQSSDRESEAYATGQALVALHQAGDLPTSNPAYERGVAFLLRTVHDDGSWLVTTHSKPIQTYFESGFPHEKSQFISICGTCWATMALVLASPVGVPASAGEVQRPPEEGTPTVVFKSGEGPYHTYRIPAVATTPRGTVLAFCEGRKDSSGDSGNIDTVLRRSTDQGRTWQPLQVVADDSEHTIGNPCPVVDRTTGTIWLLLTRNHGQDKQKEIEAGTSREPRTVWVCQSTDEGETWSKPIDISQTARKADWGWYATGPCNGIQLSSGRLVVPCHHTPSMSNVQYSHVIYSDDHGKTWQLGGIVGPNTGESTVAELGDGRLLINIRAHPNHIGLRTIALSEDKGASWSEPTSDKALVDPGCEASLLQWRRSADEPSRLVFSNPASTQRENLTVRLSTDDGQSWPVSNSIHSGPAGYTCLTVLADGSIGCLAECGQRRSYEIVGFFRFTLDALKKE